MHKSENLGEKKVEQGAKGGLYYVMRFIAARLEWFCCCEDTLFHYDVCIMSGGT
jgi:hypothetical protein